MAYSNVANQKNGKQFDEITRSDQGKFNRHSNDGSAMNLTTQSKHSKPKVIVDKDMLGTKMPGVYTSISDAIAASEPSVIKITSNLYEEQLIIRKPGLILEPKEKEGEVTLQQKENPCIVVDVGKGNTCTINNLRMILKGPNKDADPRSY